MSSKLTVVINLHEALNKAHLATKREGSSEFPGARNLAGCCEYPELHIQYEDDGEGRPNGPVLIYIGDGAGTHADHASSDVCVLQRDGNMFVVGPEPSTVRVHCGGCDMTYTITVRRESLLTALIHASKRCCSGCGERGDQVTYTVVS